MYYAMILGLMLILRGKKVGFALEAGQVLDLLSHLVDKNLVVYEEEEGGKDAPVNGK